MNPFEKVSAAQKAKEDLITFYKQTGKLDELKELEKAYGLSSLGDEYYEKLASIDREMLEKTMRKIENIFAPPYQRSLDSKGLAPTELKILTDALYVVVQNQGAGSTGAAVIKNKLETGQILEPADIELLKTSMKDFWEYV